MVLPLRGPVLMALVKAALAAAVLMLAAAEVALAGPESPQALRVSAIPDENPSELLRIYTPFAEHLSRELRVKVQFTPSRPVRDASRCGRSA